MPDEQIYFLKLAAWLSRSLGEGTAFLSEMDSDAFGIRLPESIITHPDVQGASQAVSSAGSALAESASDLDAAVSSGDEVEMLTATFKIAENLTRLFQSLDVFVASFNIQINAANIPDEAERTIAQNFAAQLARRIVDYLIINVIESNQPQLALILKTIGLIEWTQVPADPGNSLSVPHFKKSLNLHFFKDFISNPVQHLIDRIGWGSPDFNPADLFYTIEGFYHEEDDITVGTINGDAFLKRGIFNFRRDSTLTPPGISVDIVATLNREITNRIDINEAWGVGVETDVQFTGGVEAKIQPPFSLTVRPSEGEIRGVFKLFLNRNASAQPFDIIGGNSLLSLSANDTSIGLGLTATADAIAGTTTVNPLIFSEIKGLTLRLGTAEGDGFLNQILSNTEIEGQFDLGLEWSGDKGLVVKASGGIEILIPLHKTLGFIEFESVLFALRIKPDAILELEISTVFSAVLGPLVVAVERMGILSHLQLSEGSNSKYGFFDLNLGFKPPNGVGLSIDAGAVTGGGYLFFDFDKEEYAGILQLDISGFVTINAVGLITTKMPDNSKGFSLLVIMSVEFSPGIQLGFGFTFLGVGGLLGLNRTVELEVLAQGIRTGILNNIMFPQGDIIANAPRIISDLRSIFPPEEGKFLVGPMVKLGWGTPTLISVSIGVIIEIPGNFAIVGVLRVALPTADAPLIIIQVAFIGAVEFDKQRLWFFASMFESRVIFITLEGEMGLLVAWGDDANFVVSVGGFHPRFTPPPLPFPSPRRIALDLSNNPAYSVRIEGYFAVTSNTVQFGARAELRIGLDDFGIQGHIAFDALFQFSPFYFIIEISASVSLRVFGFDCFTIRLEFSLEGPTPYRARGSGYISILFWEFSADFDVTWGESQDTSLPPVTVMPLLKAEFEKIENWKAELPPESNLLVSLRKLNEATDLLVLHPVGVLRISQRAIPLDLTLDKIGSQKTTGANKFSVSVNTVNLGLKGKVDEQFAIAQFQNMSDAEKLSRPSYQPNPGGVDVSVSGNQLKTSGTVKRIVRYELITIDTNYKRFAKKFFLFVNSLFYHFFRGSAVTKSVLSQSYKQQRKPFAEAVEVLSDSFVVAFNANNAAVSDQAVFASEALAREYMSTQVAADPNLGEQLHVIPQFEAFSAS